MKKKRGRGRPPRDLTGRRFGHLIAVRPTKARSPGGQVVWACRCTACGKKDTRHAGHDLCRGKITSCGCLSNDPVRYRLYKSMADKGLSGAETARRCGVSKQAVYQTFRRARIREAKCARSS